MSTSTLPLSPLTGIGLLDRLMQTTIERNGVERTCEWRCPRIPTPLDGDWTGWHAAATAHRESHPEYAAAISSWGETERAIEQRIDGRRFL